MNWFFLLTGLGLVLTPDVRPRWVQVLAVTGLGCLLALGWEIGEWWTFIRHGTELDTAYEDTLGDMVLGTSGGFVAALLVSWVGAGVSRGAPTAPREPPPGRRCAPAEHG